MSGSPLSQKIDFHRVAKAASALMWVADANRACIWFNDAWLDFTGRTAAQEYGSGWFEGIHLDDYDRCLQKYLVSFDARKPFTIEYRLHHHGGRYRWIVVHGVPLFDDEGFFQGFSGTGWDIDNLKQQEEHIRYLEHYDQLTDLPNLKLFADRLTTLIAGSWGQGKGFTVMLADINDFKPINDMHGRAMGDEVLRIIANRLRHNLRAADTVARHGEDEFIILVPEMSRPEEAERLAEKITRALAEPLGIGRMQLNLTVTIGIASYPANGNSAEKLIAAAEQALRQAKSAARSLLSRAGATSAA
jgi:diguanylate cyclase (GGDEF)-like protein/PAS domain S-box-containing protein